VRLFDASALGAAVEAAPALGTTSGMTTRGEVDTGEPADARATESVRALTEELREQARSGRPEAAGVATYFHDSRRRMAGAWAPRTVHLPNRTKAMIQSMQAMNRAALEMMEGRTERSRRAQEDGRILPAEWRDAMREAAQRARATTSVIVAVVHDEQGRVADVRITRSSGHAEFDREVLAAARETLGHEPAPPMPADPMTGTPGGRVARYRFDVLMSAMPPIPPMVGVTFDESTGYFRVYYPGEINWRLNVIFLGARPGTTLRPQSAEAE
jgi:TonB family protein